MTDIIAHEIHKPIRKPDRFRRVKVDAVNDIWSADLVDLKMYKDSNDGYQYLLTVIDLKSRYAWCEAMKNKTGKETVDALARVFEKADAKPKKMWVDQGSEFFNKNVKKFLDPIELYYTFDDKKAVVIERFNRTLKELMFKQMTRKGTRDWVSMLPLLVQRYNARVHRSIKMSPKDAYEHSSKKEVEDVVYDKEKPKFEVGDRVRIQYKRGVFDKGYLPNWTYELFTVAEVLNKDPIVYRIKDDDGEVLQGTFYSNELLKSEQKDDIKLVEDVLKHRTYRGVKQSFVKYLGYSEKHNEWINDSDLKDLS
jgi:hypothetical protein